MNFNWNSTINASRHPHWLKVPFIHWKTCSELTDWGPYQHPPQFGSRNPTKITQLAVYMPYSREFSMQFYHQRFPSSALTDRSIYTLRNLFRINGWRPLWTSATVLVKKSNENHATGNVYALERGIVDAILPSTFPVIRIDKPFGLQTGKPVEN